MRPTLDQIIQGTSVQHQVDVSILTTPGVRGHVEPRVMFARVVAAAVALRAGYSQAEIREAWLMSGTITTAAAKWLGNLDRKDQT